MTTSSLAISRASKLLKISSNFWFVTVVSGQLIFAMYIFGLYGVTGLAGDFERWNEATTHGYVKRDFLGNLFFGIHVALAAIITLGGPLQLIKSFRTKFPRFHRINGRIYVSSAFIISLAGFYLAWVRGAAGGILGAIFVSINGVFILLCAYFTIKLAISKNFKAHRKWAIRLFLAMSGVWFFRVFLMFWLTVNQGPVGFDMETFQGPALNVISSISYIVPVLFAELYFIAKESDKNLFKIGLSIFTLVLTGCIALGSFSATMGLWLPRF